MVQCSGEPRYVESHCDEKEENRNECHRIGVAPAPNLRSFPIPESFAHFDRCEVGQCLFGSCVDATSEVPFVGIDAVTQ